MKMLSVADVAVMRKTDRVAAWRWLSRNARPHLRRSGRLIFIPEEVYRRIIGETHHAETTKRLADLEEAQREATRRLDRHAAALSRFHMLSDVG